MFGLSKFEIYLAAFVSNFVLRISDFVAMSSITASTSADTDFHTAIESAKLAALYNFAYGLSHEINNPLANIATRAQTLLADEKNPDRRRKLATIVQQAFRAHEMIADLMLFARPPQLQTKAIEIGSLLSRLSDELHEDSEACGVRITVNPLNEPLHLTADPVQLAVALRAICTNAIEAMPTGGKIDLHAARQLRRRRRRVRPHAQGARAPRRGAPGRQPGGGGAQAVQPEAIGRTVDDRRRAGRGGNRGDRRVIEGTEITEITRSFTRSNGETEKRRN
jgi:hypothetical protein